jgi:TolA-binding protein
LEFFRIMANTAIPLQDLARRIRKQQADLEKLRKEYEARQAQMRELTRRREELQAQLRQVDAELQGLEQGSTPAVAAKPGKKPQKAPVAKAPRSEPPAISENGLPLPVIITKILAKSSHPVPAQALAEEVLARGYRTQSKDFTNMIWTAAGKMANVENVPGKGYRLRKSKGKGSKSP